MYEITLVTDKVEISSGSGLLPVEEKDSVVFLSSSVNEDGNRIISRYAISDGTDDGTDFLTPSNMDIALIENVNGTLFVEGYTNEFGTELWKSDGTVEGTQLVKDINPVGSSDLSYFINVNGTLFFRAAHSLPTDTFDEGLWKSDGTAEGTQLVKSGVDVDPYSVITDVNGTLFFLHFGDLWKSDGTEQGTQQIFDSQSSSGIEGSSLRNVNGTLFFTQSAESGSAFRDELWKSDGTVEGTQSLKTLNITNIYAANDSLQGNLTDVNGTLFFVADDGIHGRELWKSDGTVEGTQLVKDITPPSVSGGTPINNGNGIAELTNVNGTLFFRALTTTGFELWKSDGTETGTQLVKSSIRPLNLTNVNGTLFFTADRANDSNQKST